MQVRGRVHTVRGKGKGAFLVLRQQTATAQASSFSTLATARHLVLICPPSLLPHPPLHLTRPLPRVSPSPLLSSQVVFFVDADSKKVSKGMVKFVSGLTKESVIDIEGEIVKPAEALAGTSQQVEIHATFVKCVSRAAGNLPFELDDASRSDALVEAEGSVYARVNLDTRLDNRVMDLRTPANQAIFRLQSAVCALFRDSLAGQGFIEIHTPKLIGAAT